MLRKTRKNVFFALSLLSCAAVACGVAGAIPTATVSANTADSALLSMNQEGAWVRVDIKQEDGETLIGDGAGIRFMATASKDLVAQLVTDGAYNTGDKLGMMVVPAKVITAYNAQLNDENAKADYFEFIASKITNATEDKIAYVYEASTLSLTEDTNLHVSLADIQDVNYNEAYQAVAYYVDNGVYYYSQPSQVRTVSEVANAALNDSSVTGTEQRAALANIIKKGISLANGGTGADYKLALDTLETANLKESFAKYITAEDLTFEVVDTSVAELDEKTNVLTGLSTDGATKVGVTAYDGLIDFDIEVTTKAVKGEKVTMHSGSKTTYTAYGATVESMTTSSVTNLPELNNIVLGAGAVPKGSSITNVASTDLAYLAFNRSGTYVATAGTATNKPGSGYSATIEFTGNNMPLVGFFVADDSETSPMKNIVGQKGILLTNGFRVNEDDKTNVIRDRYTAYGFQQLTSNPSSNDNTDATAGELDRRLDVDTSTKNPTYADAAEQALNISYNELAENPNQRYRYCVWVGTNSDQSHVYINAQLYKINDDETNGDLVYSLSWDKTYKPVDGIDFYKGNIVVYGRPYETTKIDRIHQFQRYKVADFMEKWNAN